MKNRRLPFADANRLADVLALIQVLALDAHAHRGEDGLNDELQGEPQSGSTWAEVAAQHPEFFRVRVKGVHRVSLVARHVIPKNEKGEQELSSEFVGQLLRTAIELHDRQLDRAQHWRAYVPIIVVITAGLFTVFGVFLKSWLATGGA